MILESGNTINMKVHAFRCIQKTHFDLKKCLFYLFYWLIVILWTIVTVPTLTAAVLKLLADIFFKDMFPALYGLDFKNQINELNIFTDKMNQYGCINITGIIFYQQK